MRTTKTQNGITLIALIITIVVLLILATVAITSITNTGIIEYANNAATSYQGEQDAEEGTLDDYEDVLNRYSGGTGTSTGTGTGSGDTGSGDTGNGDTTQTYVAYTAWQTVTVKNGDVDEQFYVIANSDATQEKVLLLSKGGINPDTMKQGYATVVFSTECYWDAAGVLEEPDPIPESHVAARLASDYGAQVGGVGRLPIYASEWGQEDPNGDGYVVDNAWLGLICLEEDGSLLPSFNSFEGTMWSDCDFSLEKAAFKVQAVVEISKTLVTPVNN